jgi:hypothetical protein
MTEMIENPVLPYPEPDGTATAGWSGTDTSRERAKEEAADGTVGQRQQKVLSLLSFYGPLGLTVAKLRSLTGWHHGQASSVLSTLHKEGVIARLEEKNNRCHVYVLPENVGDRPTQPFGRRKPTGADESKVWGEGYDLGIREGERRAKASLWEAVGRMQEAILQKQGPKIHSSYSLAWMDNPIQTLDAVKKHIKP